MDNVQDGQVPVKSAEAFGDVAGYYEFTVDTTGVFITVYPPIGAGEAVSASQIYTELKAKALHTVKEDVIYRATTSPTGKPILVGEYPGPEEPELKIEIAQTKMEAQLTIVPSRSNEVPSVEVVKAALAEKGIIFGIDEAQVKLAIGNPNTTVVVAKGSLAQDGKDASIQHAFDFSKIGKPKAQMDGGVDFHDLGLVFNVRAEDIIAEKIFKTEGIPGSTVMGEAVSPKPGKDVPQPTGKNVYMDDLGKIRASIDGQIQMLGGKINVTPIFEIREDVDVSTGNIDFVGTVLVRGSVQTGFSIKAEGDIEVYGTVSGASLEGKNITVKNGIQGMHKGLIQAKGNLTTKYIENAHVVAQDTIIVSEAILHSNVSAGKRIIVNGKKAVIVGGTLRAGEEIQTRVVGTHLATPTILEVGVNPALRDQYVKDRDELKVIDHQLEQSQKAIQLLKNMESNGTITPEKKEMLLKVTKSYYNLSGQSVTLRNRIQETSAQIDELKFGKIKASETINPGVKIVIGSAIMPVRDAISFVTLYEEDGDVKIGPFK